eukprot:scaffold193281_cov19-Tisochrysis_lutea.AAC.2
MFLLLMCCCRAKLSHSSCVPSLCSLFSCAAAGQGQAAVSRVPSLCSLFSCAAAGQVQVAVSHVPFLCPSFSCAAVKQGHVAVSHVPSSRAEQGRVHSRQGPSSPKSRRPSAKRNVGASSEKQQVPTWTLNVMAHHQTANRCIIKRQAGAKVKTQCGRITKRQAGVE